MQGARVWPIVAAALCLALPAAGADPQPISQAETLMFMTPHLKGVATPSRLHYAFRKSGTLEQAFSDSVDVDITGQPDGSKKGAVRFFSGTRRINYPEVEHAEGNPVVLFYLEREIHEMSRLTGGAANHFRQMIRLALAESAQIEEVDIRVGGQKITAQRITISPYDSDPNLGRYANRRLATKRYVFTLSKMIPGLVYQLRGHVPVTGDVSTDAGVLDETLTFESAGVPK
jgi:hypothetical protein